jgi:hypothetical protein
LGFTFSYSLLESDEARAIYTQMLEEDRAKFSAWRAERSERPHFPIDVAFGVWWLSKGPTAFQSGEDALRYRRELLAHIQEKLAVTDE